ncbi:uncharacterized protein LOC135472453 [Liolophura sinensis]|uniref:uncharacterized protein LOC135472453 n=1 Tax=Liolophura sinensis TaxID=3198878 RepID=UPI003157F51A
MKELVALFACFVCTAYGAFVHTDTLKTHMLTVEGQASTLMSCLDRVTHPLGAASEFSREVVELEGLITHLETRVQTTVTILHVALAVPFLGQVAAPVLGPASTVLTKMSDELEKVNGAINHVVAIIKGWLKPLEGIQKAVGYLNSKIGQVVSIMSKGPSFLPSTTVTSGCTKVQNFLAKIHLVKRKRGVPVLSQAISKFNEIEAHTLPCSF